MSVARMVICHWQGVERRDAVIDAPAWQVVVHAIGALNGNECHDLYLYPSAGDRSAYLAICGGGGRYLVHGVVAEGRARTAVDPSRCSSATSSLVAGGQTGDYPSHWIVDLTTVIAAARVYWSRGGFSSEVCWESPKRA